MATSDPLVIPLYPDTYPDPIPPEQREQELLDGWWVAKNIHHPTLSVYLPQPQRATGCGAVICPGGGYEVLAIDDEGKCIAHWLNTLGVAGFVLKYRLPPAYTHPCPMLDAQRALRLVRAHGEHWGVHPDRVGIIGFSAGGHVASTAATRFDTGKPHAADHIERMSCRPDFAVLGYPVISLTRDYAPVGLARCLVGDAAADLRQVLSNELHVTPDTPPTFLFHSADDNCSSARHSIDFAQACLSQHVPAELHLFATGGHGYAMGKPGTPPSQWPYLCQRWLHDLRMIPPSPASAPVPAPLQ